MSVIWWERIYRSLSYRSGVDRLRSLLSSIEKLGIQVINYKGCLMNSQLSGWSNIFQLSCNIYRQNLYKQSQRHQKVWMWHMVRQQRQAQLQHLFSNQTPNTLNSRVYCCMLRPWVQQWPNTLHNKKNRCLSMLYVIDWYQRWKSNG